MRGYSYRYVAAASAAVIVVFAAAQVYRSGTQPAVEEAPPAPPAATLERAEAAPALFAEAPPPPTSPGTSPDAPEISARIDDLSTQLADREVEVAALTAALAERDANLDALTARLTLREAEIQSLRDELERLRDRYAFDLELAALKSGSIEDGAPLAPADEATADAILAAAKGPAPLPPRPDVLPLTEIHFESGSSTLTPGGQIHAAAAAVMLADMPIVQVRLLGHADRVGSADRNRVLAAARARTVADFLVASGVAAEIIEADGMGEDDLPVATADGVAEPLNRSVAILAVPRPTS